MLLFLTACDSGHPEIPVLTEEPILTITTAPPPQWVGQVQDITEDFEDDPGDGAEPEPFEIYSIKGTADSVTGTRWENMLAWRAQASLFAEQYRDILFVNMDPADNAVYLTFDDGPDPVNTVRVIDTLLEYGVSGTFFFTGENIRRHEAVVKQAYDAGFSIGLHGCSHTSMQRLTEDEIIAELNETNDLLERITGSRSAIMRPPYGAVQDEQIEIISGQDLQIYLWSIDTLDWAQTDVSEILRNVKEHLRPGDIILMHAFSGQARSAEILPRMIEFIREQGYEMKALPFNFKQ